MILTLAADLGLGVQHSEVQKAFHQTESMRVNTSKRDVEEECIVVRCVDGHVETRILDLVGSGEDNMENETFLYL